MRDARPHLLLGFLEDWDLATILWTGALALGVLFVLYCLIRPSMLIRIPLWILCHTLYRLRVQGRAHIPREGGALLVCNHVSYLDWFFVMAAHRRHVRFVIFAGWTRVWGLRHLLRWAGVIPIDKSAGPRAIVQSLRLASDALGKGDLVCIFAEGRFTRTGFLLPFHRGLEQIVKHTPAPIIPVCLEQVWGSIFSYWGGKLIWKWPEQLPYPVTVAFGPPLPPTTVAAGVRLAIQKLSADCAVARGKQRLPVHRRFVRQACRHPFRLCIIDPLMKKASHLSNGKVLAGAMCLADQIRAPLKDDGMVGVWLPPSAAAAMANIALALLGKPTVNLNYTASASGVQSAIRQCGIKHVVSSKLFQLRVDLEAGPGIEVVYLEDLFKKITTAQRVRAFLKILLLPRVIVERFILGLGKHTVDDLATVIFSSGSTGEPKGVMLTHGNIAANCESIVQAIRPGPRDRILGILPFFHSFGYTVILWLPLQVGAAMVYHHDPRQSREIGELCRSHRCTIFLATPTFLRLYLRRCQPEDFKSLRFLWCGAEKLPPELAKSFQEKFGILPMEGYGCTELSPAAVANVPDQEKDGFRQIGNRPGTIGQPLPGVAARIVDRQTFQPLAPNQEGMLLIYGANVMKGYLGKDELTRQKIKDGWYVTGDLAKMDDDGFITITGREERFAKIGGEMVPLEKVEDELHAALGSGDRVVAVTAIPDESKGERIVVLHLELNGMTAQELWKKLSERGLPNIYLPSQRDFYQVPELPILGSGKLDLKGCQQKALALVRGEAAG